MYFMTVNYNYLLFCEPKKTRIFYKVSSNTSNAMKSSFLLMCVKELLVIYQFYYHNPIGTIIRYIFILTN